MSCQGLHGSAQPERGKCLNDGRECGGCVDCGSYKPPAPTGGGWEATDKSSAKKTVADFLAWYNDDPAQNDEIMWEVLANDYIAAGLASQRKALTEGALETVQNSDSASCDYPCNGSVVQQNNDIAALKSFFTQTTI